MAKSRRPVAFDLAADRVRYEHLSEVAQKVETAELVEMDDWTGIADHRLQDCLSRFHGVPIGHLPS